MRNRWPDGRSRWLRVLFIRDTAVPKFFDTYATGLEPDGVAVGDFNGDGKLDVAVTNMASNNVTILLGKGDGTFTAAASPATGKSPNGIVVGDFNGDGKLDLAVANEDSNSLTILLGNGDGTFRAAASPATGATPFGLVAGDFNGDGKLDLAVTNQGQGRHHPAW